MVKKKILFIIPEYSIGGTNTSLDNLLLCIDKSKYDISIYCLYEDGSSYFKKIFRSYIVRKSLLYYFLHDNHITRKFYGLCMRLNTKMSWEWLYRRETKILQDKYKFDTIVAYQEGTATMFASYFDSDNKVAWYHSPYMRTIKKHGPHPEKVFDSFNSIVCVSKEFVRLFQKELPLVKDKVYCVYNTLNEKLINSLASNKINDPLFGISSFTIVSLGRFVPQKQFEKIPYITNCVNNKGEGNSFKWYIIASGDACKQETIDAIRKYGLQEQVIILDAKENPYPYIANSDLVVCTSHSESFSYVINEGKILHIPVVSNNFPVAYEVLEKEYGWVTSIENMPDLLYRLINNIDNEYSTVKENCKLYRYSNEEIIKVVESIL